MVTKRDERTTIDPFEMEVVERADVGHIWRVIAKWRVLIAAGVIFVLGATYALLALTPPNYEASATVLFDQPTLIAGGAPGLDTLQMLSNLMPTLATEVTGDPVLKRVADQLGTSAPLGALRGRITA